MTDWKSPLKKYIDISVALHSDTLPLKIVGAEGAPARAILVSERFEGG